MNPADVQHLAGITLWIVGGIFACLVIFAAWIFAVGIPGEERKIDTILADDPDAVIAGLGITRRQFARMRAKHGTEMAFRMAEAGLKE